MKKLYLLSAVLLLTSYVFAQTIDPAFIPRISRPSTIYDIASQADGKILVAGNFTFVNGRAQRRLVRLTYNGEVDTTFQPTIQDTIVLSIDQQNDGKVLGGGYYRDENGNEVGVLFRLMADGSFDPIFKADTLSARVLDVEQFPQQGVMAGGVFSHYGNTPTSGLVMLSQEGILKKAFTWDDSPELTTINQILRLGNNQAYLAGAQGNNAVMLRLNDQQEIDNGFQPEMQRGMKDFLTNVRKVVLRPDSSLVFASFSWEFNPQLVFCDQNGNTLKSVDIPNPLNLEADHEGGVLLSCIKDGQTDVYTLSETDDLVPYLQGEGPDDNVSNLLRLIDGKVILAGSFSRFKGQPFSSILRLNKEATFDTRFSTQIQQSALIREMATDAAGNVIFAGRFTSLNEASAVHCSRVDTNGQANANWPIDAIPLERDINGMFVQQDGGLLLCNSIGLFDPVDFPPLLRITPDGQTDLTIGEELKTKLLGDIEDVIQLSGGDLIIYGKFSIREQNTFYQRYAVLSADGSLQPSRSGRLQSAAVNVVHEHNNGHILIGGDKLSYETLNDTPLLSITADGTGTNADFQTDLDEESVVYSIQEMTNGKLIVSGQLLYQGQWYSFLRLLNNGKVDGSFTPFSQYAEAPSSWPRDIEVLEDGRLLLSNELSFPDATYLVTDASGDIESWYNAGMSTYVSDLQFLPDSSIMLAGNFVNPSGGTALMRILLREIEEEPGDGTDNPDEPGDGTDNPDEPGDGTDNPDEPGDGTDNPDEPGDGTDNPDEPGDGTDNPDEPGDGTDNPDEPGDEPDRFYIRRRIPRVFPNPSAGQLTISVPDSFFTKRKITVINTQGQIVWQTEGYSTQQLDLSHLPAGAYWIRIEHKAGVYQQRWIKK